MLPLRVRASFITMVAITVALIEAHAASLRPAKIESGMVFLEETLRFPSDSEWRVESATDIGNSLPQMPGVRGRVSQGRFVVVVYSVKNMSSRSDAIAWSPKLRDADGVTFDSLPNQEAWLERFSNYTSIGLEQLPPKVFRTFAAIYELPNEDTILAFLAREIVPVDHKSRPVILTTRVDPAVLETSPNAPRMQVAERPAPGAGGKYKEVGASQEEYSRMVLARVTSHFSQKSFGIDGLVRVQFRVSADGDVSEFRVVESSGSVETDRAVISFLGTMDPYPPTPTGKAQLFRVPVTLH